MTALNLFRFADAIYIATDGAGFSDGAVVDRYALKAIGIPHLNCALGFRGTAVAARFVSFEVAEQFGSYDDMKSRIAATLRARFLWPSRIFRRLYDFELVVGGISERTGATDAFLIRSRATASQAPWTIIPIPRLLLTPTFPGSAAVVGRMNGVRDVEALATHVLDRQRESKAFAPALGKFAHVAGCFSQLTCVHRDGITTKIMRRWPDRIGKPVTPEMDGMSPAGALPASPSPHEAPFLSVWPKIRSRALAGGWQIARQLRSGPTCWKQVGRHLNRGQS